MILNKVESQGYHLNTIVDLFDILRTDDRWTPQMAQIFGESREELIKALKL